MDFNLAQSKLQLILSSTSRDSTPSVILFSSAYQRQDWIELIDKTKQELLLRTSANINQTNQPTRIVDPQIQKRLDLIKPNSSETNSNDSATNMPTAASSKTYSGTFSIGIHSIHGAALLNPMRQYHTLPMASSTLQQLEKSYKFYVAVEIDSYNTFYPYAQTSQQTMLQNETIEFKGEVCVNDRLYWTNGLFFRCFKLNWNILLHFVCLSIVLKYPVVIPKMFIHVLSVLVDFIEM